MKRSEAIKHILNDIRDDVDIEVVDAKVVRRIMMAYEDLLMYIVATNDNYQLGQLGKLEGVTKHPWRITRYWSQFTAVEEKHGYSDAKMGTPKITWTKDATNVLHIPASEFYAMPEHRYTTKARKYRQDAGLPEIPEFMGLSEEKILEIMEKADKEDENPLENKKNRAVRRRCAATDQAKLEFRQQQLIEEDYQEQLALGIPEDHCVRHTFEEVMKKKEELWSHWREDVDRRRTKRHTKEMTAAKKQAERAELIERHNSIDIDIDELDIPENDNEVFDIDD